MEILIHMIFTVLTWFLLCSHDNFYYASTMTFPVRILFFFQLFFQLSVTKMIQSSQVSLLV